MGGCLEPGPTAKALFTSKSFLPVPAKFPVCCPNVCIFSQALVPISLPETGGWPGKPGQVGSASEGQWKPTCKQTAQPEHTYKNRIHLFMPSISYKLSVSDPPSSDAIIPRGKDIYRLSLEPLGRTHGREPLPEVHQEELPHQKGTQTMPSQGVSNQSLGRRL